MTQWLAAPVSKGDSSQLCRDHGCAPTPRPIGRLRASVAIGSIPMATISIARLRRVCHVLGVRPVTRESEAVPEEQATQTGRTSQAIDRYLTIPNIAGIFGLGALVHDAFASWRSVAGLIAAVVLALVVLLVRRLTRHRLRPPTATVVLSSGLRRGPAFMGLFVVLIAAAGFTVGWGLQHWGRPAASIPNTCQVPPGERASFTSPSAGASLRHTITVTGCAPHIAPGHVLWLYLQIDAGKKYFPGDPDLVLTADGQWSGTIDVGGQGYVGEKFHLWIVELGTNALKQLIDYFLIPDVDPNNPPGMTRDDFVPDAQFLASIPIVGSA